MSQTIGTPYCSLYWVINSMTYFSPQIHVTYQNIYKANPTRFFSTLLDFNAVLRDFTHLQETKVSEKSASHQTEITHIIKHKH